MSNDGKKLEKLVATIEEVLLPRGFKVEVNKRIYEDGMQLGEMDVVARGKLGSGEITWLIECRDRPSEGPAPSSWIQQLEGKRNQFRFDKVTAVSTTGFAPQAEARAKEIGIELRTVDALDPKSLEWLMMDHIEEAVVHYRLMGANFGMDEDAEPAIRDALADPELRKELGNPDGRILHPIDRGEPVRLVDAFRSAVEGDPRIAHSIAPNAPPRRMRFLVKYPNDKSHYLLETKNGAVRVLAMEFSAEVWKTTSLAPVSETVDYKNALTKTSISQIATFPLAALNKAGASLELHREMETGETNIVIRRV